MPVTRPRSDSAGLPGSRYDAVLAAIPLMFALGLLLGHAAGLSLRDGLAAGSAAAALVVGYALFGSPPGSGRERGRIGQ